MKTKYVFHVTVLSSVLTICYLPSCKKATEETSISAPQLPDSTQSLQTYSNPAGTMVIMPKEYSMNCPGGPDYGDSVITSSATRGGQDYIIKPVNSPLPGRYFSWPAGLVINDTTGAINVTRSETGQRYYIGYVQNDTKDTCLHSLVLGGASYIDSIYVQTKSASSIAYPYFNGNSGNSDVCSQWWECAWDLSNNASQQHIVINRQTGSIDLNETIQAGAFGQVPVNGTTVNTTIFYILGNGGEPAVQSLMLRVMYYDNLSSVPDSIRSVIVSRRTSELGGSVNPSNPQTRPPYIVIVRNN
jgi:hypothetical protein